MVMPRRDHHTESLESWNKESGEAKGTPLSERILCGRPCSCNSRSKAVKARDSQVDSGASQSSR